MLHGDEDMFEICTQTGTEADAETGNGHFPEFEAGLAVETFSSTQIGTFGGQKMATV